MFDNETSGSASSHAILAAGNLAGRCDPVPLERLEAQICELARAPDRGDLPVPGPARGLRRPPGWASWEMNSCTAWLSWKCQLSSGTAREHVRVARALRDLPVIRAEFAAGRLSYAKCGP